MASFQTPTRKDDAPEQARRTAAAKPYLLFDAGGTLVFPDQKFLIREARKYGLTFTHRQLHDGYYRLFYDLDCQASQNKELQFSSFDPEEYAFYLFDTLKLTGPASQAIAETFKQRHLQENQWTFTYPGIAKTLRQLAGQGYRMSVLSNSDGRTKKVFIKAGLDIYFEEIFDSSEMGLAKPDPAIFWRVLEELGLEPAGVLYIGDIFCVDVLGANRAGLGGIHLDPLRLYTGWPGVHITGIDCLPKWLSRYAARPQAFDLFPFAPLPQDTTWLARGWRNIIALAGRLAGTAPGLPTGRHTPAVRHKEFEHTVSPTGQSLQTTLDRG